MKKSHIYKMLLLAGGLTFGLTACEDEVLVETKDDTKVNELLAAIAAADQQYATLNTESNTLVVGNEEAERKIEELEELREELLDPYSQPTEVHYTVTVLSSSNATLSGTDFEDLSLGRKKGFEGATVVVEQNGLVLEPSSVSNGLYLFKGLKQGYVYVRVSAPNHTAVEYRAYLYQFDGWDVAAAESFNAQNQVILYPVSGNLAAKFTGKAYANTSVLNDTLNRRYGSVAAFGAKANTYITAPAYNFYDYTYYWDNPSPYNIYGTSITGNTYVANNENALAGHKIYARPEVDQFANNNFTGENCYIYEIIYKGLITSTTIAADGSFTLPVVSAAQYSDDDETSLVDWIQIYSETYKANHTRFTTHGGNYYGQTNEAGSVEVDIKYYNNGNTAAGVYTGTGTNTVSIPSATAAVVKRRVITEEWWYFMNTENNYQYEIPVAGETRNFNIYFHPRYRN